MNELQITGAHQMKYYTISNVDKASSYQRFTRMIGLDPEEDIRNGYIIELERNIKETCEKARKRGFHRGMSYSLGRMLHTLITQMKPDTIIETGVGKGVSTSYILAALDDNQKGELISVDTSKDVGFLIDRDLKSRWKFKCGTSLEMLPQLSIPYIDIFIHDSHHTYDNMMFEYQWAYPKLKPAGILLSHDINRNDALFDFAEAVGEEVMFIRSSGRGFTMGAIVKRRPKKAQKAHALKRRGPVKKEEKRNE